MKRTPIFTLSRTSMRTNTEEDQEEYEKITLDARTKMSGKLYTNLLARKA